MAKICDALADSTRTLDAVARAILADCYLKPSFRGLEKVDIEAMVLDSILSSPRLKSPSFRRQFTKDELGSWSTLVQRHRFLLSALVLLTLLCTVYLYFAVTLGASGTCSGLTGAQKASCHMELVKDSVAKGHRGW
ncbi:hypothetical protein VIGAN_05030600 [Vigna angularis var. angularis]|uniref:Uncharacterized protein n=1 Tax=Vigna angularis var. angularis TaxID=157739 RepID=A0A0S3S2D3_PHAAN|nr:hypothetical protein VIGAN_05030600 [Vigna angularis var. angularis]